jgi:hypothetical protein
MSLNQRVTAEFSTLYTKHSSLQRLIHPNNSAMWNLTTMEISKPDSITRLSALANAWSSGDL